MPDAKPRVLVAGTDLAIATCQRILDEEAQVIPARSVREALEPAPDHIISSVRFDESRMFDFLQALRERPAGRRARIVCFRVAAHELKPSTRAAIAQALEALGVTVFLDMPQLARRHGAEVAGEILRQIVIGRDVTG